MLLLDWQRQGALAACGTVCFGMKTVTSTQEMPASPRNTSIKKEVLLDWCYTNQFDPT